jgi:hypothetical protein
MLLNIEKFIKKYTKNNNIEIIITFIKEEVCINKINNFYNRDNYIKNIIYILKNKIDKAYIK